MNKLAAALVIVFASGAAVKAGDMENLRNSSDSLLNQIEESIDGLTKAHPKPQQHNQGHPGSVHQPPPPQHNPGHVNPPNPGHNPGHPGNVHPPQPWHPGHNPGHPGGYPPPPPPPSPVHPPYNPGHPGQPGHPGWNPQPFPPPYPYPFPPPNPWHNERVRFESNRFDWSTDARKSLEDAAMALRLARYDVLEKRLDYDRYTIVFESRRYVQIERYSSHEYTWSGDAEKAARDMVRMYENRGMVILEKNIRRSSFSISYFDPRR